MCVNYYIYLHAVYTKPWSRVQFLVTDVAFKMLCFLMLNENLLIFKLTIAIPFNEQVKEIHAKKTHSQSLVGLNKTENTSLQKNKMALQK